MVKGKESKLTMLSGSVRNELRATNDVAGRTNMLIIRNFNNATNGMVSFRGGWVCLQLLRYYDNRTDIDNKRHAFSCRPILSHQKNVSSTWKDSRTILRVLQRSFESKKSIIFVSRLSASRSPHKTANRRLLLFASIVLVFPSVL